MSCPSASRVNLMTMILNCKDHDNYVSWVNLESVSMSIWSAGVGRMQAERQLKDDKMIFSIILMVVTFNIINNIDISNKIHTCISWVSKRRSLAQVPQIPRDLCFRDPTRLWSGSSAPHRLGQLVWMGSPRPRLYFRQALSRPRASKSNQANINLWNYTWTGWGWPSFMRWLSMEGMVARSSSGSSSSAPSLLVYLAASLRLNKLVCL